MASRLLVIRLQKLPTASRLLVGHAEDADAGVPENHLEVLGLRPISLTKQMQDLDARRLDLLCLGSKNFLSWSGWLFILQL